MNDKTIPRRWVTAALDNMGQDPEEVIREDYSGRGMYGDTCLGFTLDNTTQIATLSAELCRRAVMEAAGKLAESDSAQGAVWEMEDEVNVGINTVVDLFDAAREDSMGRGAIVYFPGWTLAED